MFTRCIHVFAVIAMSVQLKGQFTQITMKQKYLLPLTFIHTDFAKVLRCPPQKPPLVTMGVSGILLIKVKIT